MPTFADVVDGALEATVVGSFTRIVPWGDRVREVATQIRASEDGLDAVVHNAGATFPERGETARGIERTIALHVVGPQVLTHGLLDTVAARSGRAIWMSSGGVYSRPLELRRLQSVNDYRPGWALTPGIADSLPTFRRAMGPLLRGPTDGADTAVWPSVAPEAGREGGQFWLDRRPRSPVRLPGTRTNPEEAAALWDEVERLAGRGADTDAL